jgi:transcription initiation factor TFIIH subunit 4
MALAVSEQTSSLPTLGLSERSGSLDLEDIFTRLNLMRREQSNDGGDMDVDDDNSNNNNNPLRTTGEGFKFLLKPPADQIWTILDEFLKMQYDLRQEEGAAAVSFLLQLGFCEEGRVCRMDEFGEWETKATGALSQLGLLYPFKEEDEEEVWILPTHLSKLLSGSEGTVCGSSSLLPSAAGGALSTTAASDTTEEGIVVETNYRVYAYTSSLLKRAILELFCVQEYVMPNLFVGRLTRESCSAAFEAGIEADAIVDYLRRNAHPQALKIRTKAPVVPETIGDGIRLWEAESKRMKMEETAYYDNFESTELFEAAVEHATANGVSLWVDQKKQRMAIKLSYYGGMRSFIKTKKLELASSH